MAAIQVGPEAWCITPREKQRYEEQFRGLNPINGIVTGDQVKGFLLQSQLPPPILGHIWSLADRDADGKMDISEFSIACKLINLRLRGVELPKVLPASILAMPAVTPPIAVAPMAMTSQPPMRPTPPMVPPPPKTVPPAGGVPVMAPAMPAMGMQPMSSMPILNTGQPVVPTMGTAMLPMGQSVPAMMPTMGQPGVPMVPGAGMMAGPPAIPPAPMGGMIASSPVTSPPTAEMAAVLPAVTAAIAGEPKQRTGSVVSIESPMSMGSTLQEWAVPHNTKLRFTQVFNTNDRTRSGYLSGPQARNLMVQSRLPQQILAQIWALSDLDADGRLTCDEFVLAMHLCEIAKNGEKIPPTLPADLIPPTLRRARQGSLKSGGAGTPTGTLSGPGSVDGGDKDSPTSQVTFEDKRKQNFEKGQAELERRRKALLEIQRKEQEERERKEREEQEKRERIRLEQERRRQEEFERQLQRQKEMEEQQEEQRRQAQEQREAARREMERQRQLEWEKQRSQELQQQRQREQERVLQLKAQNQNLSIELSQRNEKVRELSQKISETRAAVSSVKATIDGMRTTRDTQMAEMSALKATLREQNQRLVALSQEKARLDAKNRANMGGAGGAGEDSDVVNQAFSNKQIILKQLQDKLTEQDKENEQKKQDIENNNSTLTELKQTLQGLLQKCETTYTIYEEKREQVTALRNAVNNDYNTQWGDSGEWPQEQQNSWGSKDDAWPVNNQTTAVAAAADAAVVPAAVAGMTRYRALFEFVARNQDELSFQPGDIIMVPNDHNAEPGWLAGEIRGATGWFPESYVELAEPAGSELSSATVVSVNTPTSIASTVVTDEKRPLEGIVEVPENVSENGSSLGESGPAVVNDMESPVLGTGHSLGNVTAQALYAWKGKKPSHLSFAKGDIITVQEQQELWSYGELNGLQGWFPNSYVKIEDSQAAESGEYYMAMYPYQSGEPGDLTFEQGEVIFVTKKDGDWWTGTIGGVRTGIFPANYAQIVETQQPATTTVTAEAPAAASAAAPAPEAAATTTEDIEPVKPVEETPQSVQQVQPVQAAPEQAEMNNSTPPPTQQTPKEKTESISTPDSVTSKSPLPQGKSKKPEIAQVLAPYQATSAEQLSLQRGQLVMVRKKTSTGWWEGELQAKGKKRQVGWFPASYVKLLTSSGTASGRTTPTAKFRDTPSPMFGKDRVIAMYSYEAQNSDELSFEKDEVITILSREDPSWWKGELQGATGLFPSNYVAAIPTDNLDMGTGSERKRQGYIQELIETEHVYIDDMKIVHEAFETPLKTSKVISADQVQNIFVNWEEILQCNNMLLRALRVRRDMSPGGEIRMIGDIMCENLPRMTVYARFCSCQLNAATLLQQLTENSPEFKRVVKQCQLDPRTKGMPLSSFLIKPMQRITKYPLIIKKILEHTPDNHPDKLNLQEALAKAEELCMQVNEGVREKENCDRLEWLQSHVHCEGLEEPLIFNSVTNSLGHRKLLHHGSLKKANSGRELIVFLMNDFLLLTTPNKPNSNHTFSFERSKNLHLKLYKKPLFLNKMTFSEGSETCELRLESNDRDYVLTAPSRKEKTVWLKHLADARTQLLDKETSYLQRQQSKQEQFGACGRILINVVEGSDLMTHPLSVRQRAPKGCLMVVVVQGEGLFIKPSRTAGKCDAFCEVSMGSQEQRTPVVSGTSPRWNASMQFLVKDLADDVLCFTVFDRGYFAPNEFLGRSEVRVKDIPCKPDNYAGPYTTTLKLREVESGTITLKLDLRLFDFNERRI